MKRMTSVIAAAALLGSSARTLAADTKLGVLMDITGPIASFIPPLQNAANLAVKQVNEQGGLLDGQAVAVFGDTTGSAQGAVDAAGKLVGIVSEGDFIRRSEIGTQRKRGRFLKFILGPGQTATDFVREHGRKVAEIMTKTPLTITDRPVIGIQHALGDGPQYVRIIADANPSGQIDDPRSIHPLCQKSR